MPSRQSTPPASPTPANPKVDAYLARLKTWQPEVLKLRTILLESHLTEDFKWGKPCYTFQNSNIAIIQPFKESCALMFFKGALLKDPRHVLQKVGENTQAARRILFSSVMEIADIEPTLQALIAEAIQVEKAGLKVTTKKKPEPVPEELQKKFNEIPGLKKAFEALTPGRQRAYILHFSQPKQSKTRESRIDKSMPRILEGKGLND